MTMDEVEQSIREDLTLLGDSLNRMAYLLGCAREDEGIPEEQRRKEDLVRGCQTETWIRLDWQGDRLRLVTDSRSALVKGALSLLKEIYQDRTREDLAGYHCTLLEFPLFDSLFQEEQRRGLVQVLQTLEGAESDGAST